MIVTLEMVVQPYIPRRDVIKQRDIEKQGHVEFGPFHVEPLKGSHDRLVTHHQDYGRNVVKRSHREVSSEVLTWIILSKQVIGLTPIDEQLGGRRPEGLRLPRDDLGDRRVAHEVDDRFGDIFTAFLVLHSVIRTDDHPGRCRSQKSASCGVIMLDIGPDEMGLASLTLGRNTMFDGQRDLLIGTLAIVDGAVVVLVDAVQSNCSSIIGVGDGIRDRHGL